MTGESLATWRCDTCGGPDVTVADGYVVWRTDEHFKEHDFRIIHQSRCDPGGEYSSSRPLEDFLGAEGLVVLTAILSLGPVNPIEGGASPRADLDQWVDFVRRVQVPYYEEARPYLSTDTVREDYAGLDIKPYLPDELRKIAREALRRLNDVDRYA